MQSLSHNNKDAATDLLKRVRKIEIKTRSLSHQIFAGEYHSAFKGRFKEAEQENRFKGTFREEERSTERS